MPAQKAAPTKPGQVTTKDNIRLPLWAWALVAGAGAVVAWRFYQARKSAAGSGGSDGASVDGTKSANDSQYSLIPVPVATTTGNSPAEEANYQSLLNNIQNLQGQVASSPGGSCVMNLPYKVKPGDTLASIGKQFGISAEHVALANNIKSGTTVVTGGQQLSIPFNWCLAFPNLASKTNPIDWGPYSPAQPAPTQTTVTSIK